MNVVFCCSLVCTNARRLLSYAQTKSMPSQPRLKGTNLCTSLRHTLHTPKKFRQKFSLSYIYTSSKWYSQHLLNFGQESKKMHLNFGTCPHRQEANPSSWWGRHPRTKGLEKSGGAGRILQFMKLIQWNQGRCLWQGIYSSSNWHQSLPSLAEPVSVPCSTVQQIGITFQSLGHSVQTHGSRT